MSQDASSSEPSSASAPRLEEASLAVKRGDHARAREILKEIDTGSVEREGSSHEAAMLEQIELALRNDSFGIGIALVTGVTLLVLSLLLF